MMEKTLQYVLAAGKSESLLTANLKVEVGRSLGRTWENTSKSGERYLEQTGQVASGADVAGRQLNGLKEALRIDARGGEVAAMTTEQVCLTWWGQSLNNLWGSGPDVGRVAHEVQDMVSTVERAGKEAGITMSPEVEANMLGVVVGAVVEYGKAQGQFGFTPDEFRLLIDTATAPLIYRRDELHQTQAGEVLEQLTAYYK